MEKKIKMIIFDFVGRKNNTGIQFNDRDFIHQN